MKKSQELNNSTEQTPDFQKQSIFRALKPKTAVQQTTAAEDKIDLERREAFIEPQTRDLLRNLLVNGDEAELVPTYNPGIGYIYQTTDKISGNVIDIPKDQLENLARLDILDKTFFDSISTCPNCRSTVITLHNRCPKCKSHNVDKTSLTEHIPCGYINQRDKYTDDRCPQCGELLVEGQYKNMGRWYICHDCSERFENPDFDLICRKCSKDFAIKEAQVIEISKFSLNLARKKEVRQNVASLEDTRALLTQLGFTIEMPGLAMGLKSGMQHHFSLIGKKQVKDLEMVIALDHAISESEVQTSPLILYIYKTSEVKVDIPIFIAMPQLSETAKKIAQGHEILLIEGSTDDPEVAEKIKRDIEARIEMKLIEEEVRKKKLGKKPSSSFIGKLKNKIAT